MKCRLDCRVALVYIRTEITEGGPYLFEISNRSTQMIGGSGAWKPVLFAGRHVFVEEHGEGSQEQL